MPTITGANLTLTQVNLDVTINVTFIATFTEAERMLTAGGVRYYEHIRIIGIDPPGSTNGTELQSGLFPITAFPVLPLPGPLVIARNVSKTVSRSALQEDSGLGDTDEIRCKIHIHTTGLPPEFTPDVFTDQEVLLG